VLADHGTFELGKLPTICIIIRPAGVVVSMFSVTERKPAPASAIRSMMCSTSFSERDSRSSFQTTTVSPSRNWSSEFRDRTFENQSFRASGLSLLTAAIVHWNTIYLDQAVQYLRAQGVVISNELLAHVAPLGWEHIALTGDYDWNTSRPADGLRPLRAVPEAFALRAA